MKSCDEISDLQQVVLRFLKANNMIHDRTYVEKRKKNYKKYRKYFAFENDNCSN